MHARDLNLLPKHDAPRTTHPLDTDCDSSNDPAAAAVGHSRNSSW